MAIHRTKREAIYSIKRKAETSAISALKAFWTIQSRMQTMHLSPHQDAFVYSQTCKTDKHTLYNQPIVKLSPNDSSTHASLCSLFSPSADDCRPVVECKNSLSRPVEICHFFCVPIHRHGPLSYLSHLHRRPASASAPQGSPFHGPLCYSCRSKCFYYICSSFSLSAVLRVTDSSPQFNLFPAPFKVLSC